ncbi:hypothetical protein UFOVP1151_39 [uncultured Caudovirales phage]|uniref:Uncharacterized protein n=1 Tax=uncultured Caudovirales phage TaxID=2100421 RepID=A0A6J5QQ97_9CAUD|nr:hypothetical protein UFOVP1151_39 [uncultured Caudovirales phage]
MIHEFRNPIPVSTDIGYGWLMYVRDGGTWSNDIFAIVLEEDGIIRHMRTDQFKVLQNPTFDIQNKPNV